MVDSPQRDRASDNNARTRLRTPAFTLVELVIVIVIIAIVAAIAVTRTSSAADSAKENSLRQTVTVVRKAMEMYMAEHGQFPGKQPANGSLRSDVFIAQLIQYSAPSGHVSTTGGSPYLYGPYLRAPFPTNLYTGLADVAVIDNPSSTPPAKGSTGWVAIFTTGNFGPNMPGTGNVDATDIVNGRATINGKTIDLTK